MLSSMPRVDTNFDPLTRCNRRNQFKDRVTCPAEELFEAFSSTLEECDGQLRDRASWLQ